MKVLVLGAAGKTGSAVVHQALAAGHEVTAFVQKADEYRNEGVRVVEGDATDSATMEHAVAGHDAVLDAVGGKTPYKTTTLEEAVARNVISSMQRNDVHRLVVISMVGEGDSKANATIWERLLVSTFLHGADKDKAAMEAAVETSDLDWTILRPAILSDDAATGDVKIFESATGAKAHRITRADLATFMVDQLSSKQYLKQAVTIGNS